LNLGKHVNNLTKEDDDFDSMKAMLQDLKTESVGLVVVLLPDKDANTYATLQRAADVAVGIQTICTISGEYGPKTGDDFYANLVMRFNLKASANTINHILDRDRKGPILDGMTCILRMDVLSLL
jgi:hypothetical protein